MPCTGAPMSAVRPLPVTEEEFHELAAGFGRADDIVRLFVQVLGFKRAQRAWRVWLSATGFTFREYCDCFEVKP